MRARGSWVPASEGCEAMTLRCRPRERGDPVLQGEEFLRCRNELEWLGVYWSPRSRGRQRLGLYQEHLSTSGFPLPRGRTETRVAHEYPRYFHENKRVALSQRKISPCFGFGPGDRPHSFSSSPSSRGGWRADKTLAWIARPEVWFRFPGTWA